MFWAFVLAMLGLDTNHFRWQRHSLRLPTMHRGRTPAPQPELPPAGSRVWAFRNIRHLRVYIAWGWLKKVEHIGLIPENEGELPNDLFIIIFPITEWPFGGWSRISDNRIIGFTMVIGLIRGNDIAIFLAGEQTQFQWSNPSTYWIFKQAVESPNLQGVQPCWTLISALKSTMSPWPATGPGSPAI